MAKFVPHGERQQVAKRLGRALRQNAKLPAAIHKRLVGMYAGTTGLSGPQIVDFFSSYSLAIKTYRYVQPPPRRAFIFDDCLARLSLGEQRRAIGQLLDSQHAYAYGPPSAEDLAFVRRWLAGDGGV